MKNKIELILQFMVYSNFGGNERLFVGVYRMRVNRRWVYNITANQDEELLKETFDGLGNFKAVQKEKKWMNSWGDVTDGLVKYFWIVGFPDFCHPEYIERIWKAYEYRQECYVDNWCLALGLRD